jgi:hypothetical protein
VKHGITIRPCGEHSAVLGRCMSQPRVGRGGEQPLPSTWTRACSSSTVPAEKLTAHRSGQELKELPKAMFSRIVFVLGTNDVPENRSKPYLEEVGPKCAGSSQRCGEVFETSDDCKCYFCDCAFFVSSQSMPHRNCVMYWSILATRSVSPI